MGNVVDCECSEHIQKEKQNEVTLIEKKLQQYALTNKINRIPRKKRAIIQLCFTLNQKHVSDRLIELYDQKSPVQNELFQSLKQIDLQGLDQLYYLTRFQNIPNLSLRSTQTRKMISLTNNYEKQGIQIIKQNSIGFIALADCFGTEKTSLKTDLTSQKTPIELFVEKIEAFNCRYEQISQVFIICCKKLQKKIRELVKNLAIVVPFSSSFPIIYEDGKIVLYGDSIKFHEKMGDLISFIQGNSQIKQNLLSKKYINFCDISNIVSPLIDANTVGYLERNPNIETLLSMKGPQKQSFSVQKNFVELTEEQKQLIGDFLVKTNFLVETSSKIKNKYQIFGKRIRKQKYELSLDQFYFSRGIADILYQPTNVICQSQYWANSAKQYSNICKKELGVKNQSEEDLIEISLDILHGDTKKMKNIRKTLRQDNKQQIGFPLLILKKQSN